MIHFGKSERKAESTMEEDRARILGMLKDGKITVEEAEKLLDALKADKPREDIVLKDSRGRKSKKLRIYVDSGDKKDAKVNLKIPLSLVRTVGPLVSSYLPNEARQNLEQNGIHLEELLEDVDSLLQNNMEEDIVNVDTEKDGKNIKVRIYIE